MQSPVSASKCLLVITQEGKNPPGLQQDTDHQSPVGVRDFWLVAQPKCSQLWSTSPGAPPTTIAIKSTLESSLDLDGYGSSNCILVLIEANQKIEASQPAPQPPATTLLSLSANQQVHPSVDQKLVQVKTLDEMNKLSITDNGNNADQRD